MVKCGWPHAILVEIEFSTYEANLTNKVNAFLKYNKKVLSDLVVDSK